MRQRDILFPLFIFLLMSSSVYALEFYTPEEIQGLSYVSIFEYAQNTTDPAWWDPWGVWGTGNESEYFSAWDFEFNNTEKSWVATTEGLDFTSPVDEVQLTIHPIDNATYGKFRFYDSTSSVNTEIIPYWFGSSANISPNKEVVVYVSYSVNNTTYLDTGNTVLFVYDNTTGEQLFRNNTLPTTAGTIHNITGIIPADIYNNQYARAYIGFWFEDLEAPVEITVYDFLIFTLDLEEPFLANNFTTAYGLDQCNASQYQENFYMENGRQIFAVNETTGYLGVPCVVYLHDNVTYTRRATEIQTHAGGGSPPMSSYHTFISSRDKAFIRNTDLEFSGEDSEAPMLFTQIQTNLLKLHFDNGTAFYGPQLVFSDTGLVNLTTILDYCIANYDKDSVCSYELTSAGDTYSFTWNQYGSSESHETFLPTYCQPVQACSFGSKYWFNADCSTTEPISCGALDCNDAGTDCNYPKNPEYPTEDVIGYGSFCFESNNYSYYTVNVTGLFVSSCVFPDQCRQLTDITTLCLTDEEYDDSLKDTGPITDRIAHTLADTMNLEVLVAKLLVVLVVALGSAYFLTKDKPNSQDVQLGIIGAVFVVGFQIDWVPWPVFMTIILLILGLYYKHYKDMGNRSVV